MTKGPVAPARSYKGDDDYDDDVFYVRVDHTI